MPAILMDAGPLTALLNPNDEWHAWARETMRRLPAQQPGTCFRGSRLVIRLCTVELSGPARLL